MSRRQVALTVVIAVVFISVLGVVYLQVSTTAHANRVAWISTRELIAGEVLGSANVHQVHIPETGDSFAVLSSSPMGRRVGHRLGQGGLLRDDDLLPQDLAEVPISIRTSAGLNPGDRIDVYASIGSRTLLIARGLLIESPGIALVPAADEPFWVSLAASSTTLIAARGNGLDVFLPAGGLTVDDAIRHLGGVASGSAAGAPPSTPTAAPSPTPSR
ncbi:MAG: CpaB family protein [Candidatus Dormibacteria bacterium]